MRKNWYKLIIIMLLAACESKYQKMVRENDELLEKHKQIEDSIRNG